MLRSLLLKQANISIFTINLLNRANPPPQSLGKLFWAFGIILALLIWLYKFLLQLSLHGENTPECKLERQCRWKWWVGGWGGAGVGGGMSRLMLTDLISSSAEPTTLSTTTKLPWPHSLLGIRDSNWFFSPVWFLLPLDFDGLILYLKYKIKLFAFCLFCYCSCSWISAYLLVPALNSSLN